MSFWDTLLTISSPIPIEGKTKETPLTEALNPAGALNRRLMAQALMPDYLDKQEQGKHGGFNRQANALAMPLFRGMGR
jgi:hypothetical protein